MTPTRQRQREALNRPTIAGIVSGTVVSIFAGIALLLLTPKMTELLAQPTCANPRNLALKIPRIEPTPSEGSAYVVNHLVDGSTSDVWVPPEKATLDTPVRFTFDHTVDLQLICVVNGQPVSQVHYDGAGKVRAFRVVTDATAGRKEPVSPLTVQPPGQIQNRQDLQFDRGNTESVTLQIESTYAGLGVKDPAQGDKWVLPNERTAVAEVEFYVSEEDR